VSSAVSFPAIHVFHKTNISQVDDYDNGESHIDIWTGSSTVSGGDSQIDCEDDLTEGGTYSIVRDPPTNYGVNSKYLLL